MIFQYNNFDDFAAKAREIGIPSDLKALLTLNIIFYEEYEDYMIISLTDFDARPNKILVLSEHQTLVYPEIVNAKHGLYSANSNRYSEPTITIYLALKKVLSDYVSYFETIKSRMEHASDSLDVDEIEDVDKQVKRFSDVIHDFERLLIDLEESNEMHLFDKDIVAYDFDLLLAKATHLKDRVRGARKEINIARDKCEVNYSKQLNKNIERLTFIVAILTIVTLIISVPNTVATIYGIAPISQLHGVAVILGALVVTTLLSIVVSWYYIKKWNLKF
jgi:Mg2+ and Co2+ transporter CorA